MVNHKIRQQKKDTLFPSKKRKSQDCIGNPDKNASFVAHEHSTK